MWWDVLWAVGTVAMLMAYFVWDSYREFSRAQRLHEQLELTIQRATSEASKIRRELIAERRRSWCIADELAQERNRRMFGGRFDGP